MLKPAELSRRPACVCPALCAGPAPASSSRSLDSFPRNHQRVGALVIVTDPIWCVHDAAIPGLTGFRSGFMTTALAYSGGCCPGRRSAAWRRVLVGLGCANATRRTAIGVTMRTSGIRASSRNRPTEGSRRPATATVSEIFPEISLLDAAVKQLPAHVPVVLVVPPIFRTTIPNPGTPAAAEQAPASAALKRVVAGRPHKQLHQLPHRLCADPRPRELPGLRSLSRPDRAPDGRGIADSIRLGD